MILTIEAVDEEFAVATDGNVNVSPGSSIFDNPPNATKNLVISSNDGDDDPRQFELGDTYDVSFSGNGGTSIEDAVVVRSDLAPGGGGIIVFEGTDENGDLSQVIWTPGFDLENWYWTYYTPSADPQFYTTDQNASYTHSYVCFHARTPISTPVGLVPAGKLRPGDHVCTWGGVKREILWVGRRQVDGRGDAAPVRFAKGAIGNFEPIKLSPQHRVLVTAPQAEILFDNPEVMVPALALVDGRAVRRAKQDRVTYVHILLACHDILIAAGAPCESLFLGEMTDALLPSVDRNAIQEKAGQLTHRPARPLLSKSEAQVYGLNWSAPVRAPALF